MAIASDFWNLAQSGLKIGSGKSGVDSSLLPSSSLSITISSESVSSNVRHVIVVLLAVTVKNR